MLSVMFFVCVVTLAVYFMHRYTKHLEWHEHHYLYRVRCEEHNQTLYEGQHFPDVEAYFCTLCTWRVVDNLTVDQRDFTRFSEWERVG